MKAHFLKNFIKISIVLFVVISSIFFFNVITLSNCRSLNVFKSVNDFGIDHIYDCVSIQNVKNNIKLLLVFYQ